MQTIARRMTVALVSLVALAPQLSVAQEVRVAGFWKLVSFQTQDVTTTEVHNVFGERPNGHMAVMEDGRFYAYAFNAPAAPKPTVYDDIACSLADCDPWRYGTVYSGRYRLDGAKFVMRVDRARTEGAVGVQPFDQIWTEGRSASEEVRNFRIEIGETVTLQLETPPMINPNGSGNTIIGRVVWERE